MKRALALSLFLLLIVMMAGCRSSHRTPVATQENFGVVMARMNLWREALFRFKRAVQMTPGNATAHNNLAVAYEANGDFENAAREYREAMRLDKSNQYIQKNYSRFVEFTSRNKKWQQRKDAPKTAAASTPASATPASASPPPATGASAPPPAAASGDGPGSTAQPTGTAPAAIPPAATAAAPPPAPPEMAAPPPAPSPKPPGEQS